MSPNMCCIFALVAIICIITPTSANPVYVEKSLDGADLPGFNAAEFEGLENLNRQRRVTCDVLSAEGFGVKLGDAPCALHCLQLKKKGGHCSSGVCVCRN